MARFEKGKSGNPGGRPKIIGELRELARSYAPEAIKELARLATKAKNETARVAAIRELLDRGYGRPTQPLETVLETKSDLQPLQLVVCFEKADPALKPKL